MGQNDEDLHADDNYYLLGNYTYLHRHFADDDMSTVFERSCASSSIIVIIIIHLERLA
jgi:hypothetical protein